jgi:4-hydroxybenzoyl-CoA reductase subunit alpha
MAYRPRRNLVQRAPGMLEYKSPTSLDMCEVESFLVGSPDPNGPFGAKEVGQGPLLPVPPAIANAVHDAVGVRIDEVPITAEKVLRALERKRRGHEGRVGPTSMPPIAWPEPLRVALPGNGAPAAAEPARREA